MPLMSPFPRTELDMDVRLKSKYQLRQIDPEPSISHGNAEFRRQEPQVKSSESSVRWVQLRKLGSTLYPTNSPHGKPTTMACGRKYLAVGTFSAEVLIFDYEQNLVAQLSPHDAHDSPDGMMGPVTTLAFSSDETHVVAGFGMGGVCLIDLETPNSKPRLLTVIHPLHSKHSEDSKFRYQETHNYGVPVVDCAFITGRNRTFLSLDASGVLIAHKYHRVMLEYTHKSRCLLGSHDKPMLILSSSISDNMIALLTPDLLEIIWINAQGAAVTFQEVARILRSRDTNENSSEAGMTCFYHDSSHKNSKSQMIFKLVYSWGNDLKVLQLDMTRPITQCASVIAGYKHHSRIIQSGWLKSDLVVLFSNEGNGQLDFVELNDAKAIDEDKLPASMKLKKLIVSGYSIFVLGDHEFSVGKLANWADRLLAFVNNGQPAAAVKLAVQYYKSNGDLSIIGLPPGNLNRQAAVKRALPDLVLTAIHFSAQYDQEKLKKLLPEAIQASALMKVKLLEPILEIVDQEQWARELFFGTLFGFVLEKKLSRLPPAVFKELVLYNPDPRLFYNLDLSTLDLDLAFSMCAEHPESLAETKIYLQNNCLQDYTTPLNDSEHVFGYLAMTLTSRIYPTGEELSEELAANAKGQIFDAIFHDGDNEMLENLLSLNTREFYIALNEAFEDSWLNNSNVISRQTILNILLSRVSAGEPPEFHLSVFVARNYPKYRQFLVISESHLQAVADQLCESSDQGDKDEIQLALLSLLAVHKPRDMGAFIDKLTDARYMLVLHHLLKQKGQLLKFANLMLRVDDYDDFWPTMDVCILQYRNDTIRLLTEYFEKLIKIDVDAFSRLIVLHNISEIWSAPTISYLTRDLELGTSREDPRLQFLSSLFDNVKSRGGKLPPMDIRILYIEMLATSKSEQPEKLINLINEILVGPNDVDLPRVVDTLNASQRTDALAIILCRKDRKVEASIYLRNTIRELAAESEDSPSGQLNWYIRFAFDISLEISRTDKDQGKTLCQELIETLIESDLSAELNELVSAIIESNLIDVSQMAQLLLADSKSKASRLSKGDTPAIISQMYSTLARREQGLRCFYEIVSKEGYYQYLEVLAGRSQGWIVPVEGECEICGRKVVGLGINAKRLYAEWWANISEGTPEGDTDSGPYESLHETSLLSFHCGHNYHFNCHRRMTDLRVCVACEPN